jgi:hypothetical protein
MIYGIQYLRGRLKQALVDPGHCGTTVRAARLELAQAEAERDNDRRDRALRDALWAIDAKLAFQLFRSNLREKMKMAITIISTARRAMMAKWQQFAKGCRYLRKLVPLNMDLRSAPRHEFDLNDFAARLSICPS